MIKQYLSNFLAKHFNQIKTGSPKVLIIKIIKSPTIIVKLFEFVISIFLFILLKILKFFLLIRFGIYRCDQMGQALNLELYFSEKKKEKKFTLDFFIKKKKRFVINTYIISKKKNYIVAKFYI